MNATRPMNHRHCLDSRPNLEGLTPAPTLRAFTLLELLVAVVVFSVVLAAINAVFYGAVRLRNKTVNSIDEAWPVQQAITMLQRDLANIVTPGGPLSGTLQTSRIGGQSQTAAASTLPNQGAFNQPGQSSPDFYTATALLDDLTPWAEVQKVSYYLINPTNGGFGKDLVRSVTRNLLPSLQEQPQLTPLMSGVQSIYFQFHDGTQWQESWDSTTGQVPLPKAIKVQITMANPNETSSRDQSLPIELIVPLWAGGVTNLTAQTTGGGP